jgi:hypothetical protein
MTRVGCASWIAAVAWLHAATATADPLPGTGLGPLESSLSMGELGAPRSATAESRFGVSAIWARGRVTTVDGEIVNHGLSLFLEAHLEFLDVFEVGLDVEALQFVSEDVPAGTLHRADRISSDFGFLVPRFKATFFSLPWLDLAAGVGVLLPTSSSDSYADPRPIGFDPTLLAAIRPLPWLSVHLSLPFVVDLGVDDSGATARADVYFCPSLGVTALPWREIGGFAEIRAEWWLDAAEVVDPLGHVQREADTLQLLSVAFGLRSFPIPELLLEAAALIPGAGARFERLDVGVAFRAAYVPDWF